MTVIETQKERTDLPLVVMPSTVTSMIKPITDNLPLLHDIARVRIYEDSTFDQHTVAQRTADADAVVVVGFHVTDALLDELSGHVHCFVFGGTGVASYINLNKTRELGIRVCNVVRYGDHAVAEHTYALVMELARHVGQLNAQVRGGEWNGADGISLHDKTIGLVGFGGIGQTVARIANGFGMKPMAWNSHLDASAALTLGVTPVDDLGELLALSDIVSIHMPLLPATEGIVKAEHLERMRAGTLFVNTARAEIIERGALTRRLLKGDIPAALDVFEQEPLPADDPLFTIPGVMLTPHVAWRNDEAYVSLTKQVVQSLAAFFTGGEFNVVR